MIENMKKTTVSLNTKEIAAKKVPLCEIPVAISCNKRYYEW